MVRRKTLRSPRLARKERKRATKKVMFVAILVVLVLGGILYTFSRSTFRISSVEIVGEARIPRDLIEGMVEGGLSGTYFGVIPKSHALLYPKSAIRETLLDKFSELSSVSLSLRNLSTLRVGVHEREPKALFCAQAYGCFLMDETGFVFAEAPGEAELSYYRLEAAATSTPLRQSLIDPKRLMELLSFLKALEDLDLDPVRATLKERGEVDVALHLGFRLMVRESAYAQSLANLEVLLSEDNVLPRSGKRLDISYIDLRYGNKIYFKPVR